MKEKHADNFWDESDLKVIEPFKTFYKKDKSRGKKDSSLVMWCLYYMYNRNSDLYNIPEKEDLVKKDVLGDVGYIFDEQLVERYIEATMSQAEKSLYIWEDMIKKRDKVLKDTDYTLDEPLMVEGLIQTTKSGQVIMVPGTAKQIDTAIKATPAMMKDFLDMKAKLLNENSEADPQKQSLSESGEI